MADSLSPSPSDLINVNYDTKPDSSNCSKSLPFNKDNVNQNNFEKSSSSDKFKNSPLLTDKKLLLSPKVSPQPERKSPKLQEPKIINSPSPAEGLKSPSPIREEKIINSPLSGRSSVSNSQEFRIVNPTSRSASVSSQVESAAPPLDQCLHHPGGRSNSENDDDSMGDAEIMELLSDDAVDPELTGDHEDVFAPATEGNKTNLEQPILNPDVEVTAAVRQELPEEEINTTFHKTHNNAAAEDEDLDETIATLEFLEAEGLSDDDKTDSAVIEVIQNRSSAQFDSEEALLGLLEIAEMADDIG